jgi:hypothetical protein
MIENVVIIPSILPYMNSDKYASILYKMPKTP